MSDCNATAGAPVDAALAKPASKRGRKRKTDVAAVEAPVGGEVEVAAGAVTAVGKLKKAPRGVKKAAAAKDEAAAASAPVAAEPAAAAKRGRKKKEEAAAVEAPASEKKPRKKRAKKERDPNKPRKLSSFMVYSNAMRASVKAANPSLKTTEIGSLLGKMWKALSAEDKGKYPSTVLPPRGAAAAPVSGADAAVGAV